ncbi:MAG: hypothetical protein QM811_18850 [Pirellulales bacterium]
MSTLPPLPAPPGLFVPDDDFSLCVDLLEPLVLERHDTLSTVPLTRCLRRSQLQASTSSSPLGAAKVRFHLDADELPDPPRADDLLLDAAGVIWTITAVRTATNRSRYLCWCEQT